MQESNTILTDKSINTWNEVAKLPLDELKSAMCAAYNKDTNFFPTTPYRFLDSTKKLRILDFGCGIGRQLPELLKYAEYVDGCDVSHLCDRICNPKFEDKIVEQYKHIYGCDGSNLLDLLSLPKYDMIVCSFTLQFFHSKEYLNKVLEVLSSISPYIYIHSRIWMEDGSNIFESLFHHQDLSLELGDGQDLGFLISQNNTSNIHIEQVYASKKVSPTIIGHIGDNKKGNFIYKSYNDAFSDLRKWAKRLQISGVAGIPRSGVALAAYLSHHLNIPLYSLENLRLEESYFRPNNCRPLSKNLYGPILVLDDTCWSGFAMERVKAYLHRLDKSNVIFGSLYVSEHAVNAGHVDTYYEILDSVNHTFEWNFMRDPLTQKYMVDMDGVLCEDYEFPDEVGPFYEAYQHHLNNAKPLYLPHYPVYKVVTGRLEKWRKETENWLQKNGVVYSELVMANEKSHKERNMRVREYKAKVYAEDKYAVCFVESGYDQADFIKNYTGKPVFCTDVMIEIK